MTVPLSVTSQPFITSPSTPASIETVAAQIPEGTRRAVSTSDMVKISPPFPAYSVTYNVGYKPETHVVGTHVISNESVTTDIRVDIITPSFLKVLPEASFILHPDVSFKVTIVMDELDIRTKSMSSIRDYSDQIRCTITPLNVTSPVYVRI